MNNYIYNSPIGGLILTCDEDFITGLYFSDHVGLALTETSCSENNNYPKIIRDCMGELTEYFEGTRKDFSIPISNKGTPFRETVWQELKKIPYGETITYGELARRISRPKSVRAVGGANHHNNISIIVPCHRVIGANGNLTGYGGGLWRKKWLLEHEKSILAHTH